MKRLIAITVLLAAVGVIAVLGTGADGGDGGSYKVRAIFRNAFSVIPGEDVKIAGVKVGKIGALDVERGHLAAVVLDITEPGFQDFRQDATCTIRPQSLIGEKFVECTPTQPRPPGQAAPPPLQKIESGPGKGQYLLPVTHTRRPVDLDLLNNIMRLPYRERFSIILNELGVGLAARGADLRVAIRQADPALEETDKVLKILAEQNRVLADLATNGDKVLAPLARERSHVAGFIENANITAQASAERRVDIERNIQKFPAFLEQLKPTMVRLGAFSDQLTPVLTDLGGSAPSINQFVEQLGPFSQAATPAFQTLGDASDAGRQALVKGQPLARQLKSFAGEAKPLTANLSQLLSSFKDTGGIERLMDFLFFGTSAFNGYDAVGHYLRAVLVVNTCETYAITPTPGCNSNFYTPGASAAKKASAATVAAQEAGGRSPYLARMDAVLHGLDPKALTAARGKGKGGASRTAATRSAQKLDLPPVFLPGQSATPATGTARSAAPAPSSAAPAAQADGAQGTGATEQATQTLLDYLLGGSS